MKCPVLPDYMKDNCTIVIYNNIFQTIRITCTPVTNQETDIYKYGFTSRSSVLPNGQFVLGAGIRRTYKFYILNKDRKSASQTMKGLCPHHRLSIDILPLKIQDIQYLAVSCSEYNNIHLIDIFKPKDKPLAAYKGYNDLGTMCLGPSDTIYTANRLSGQVSQLDCTTTNFIQKDSMKYKIKPSHMCYVPSSELLVLSSQPSHMCYVPSNFTTIPYVLRAFIRAFSTKFTTIPYVLRAFIRAFNTEFTRGEKAVCDFQQA